MPETSEDMAQHLRGYWRARVAEAQGRYRRDCSGENRAEYQRVLKIFSDLVVHEKAPEYSGPVEHRLSGQLFADSRGLLQVPALVRGDLGEHRAQTHSQES